jgi:hypothetical protein
MIELLDDTRPSGSDPIWGPGKTGDVWARETRAKINEIIKYLEEK